MRQNNAVCKRYASKQIRVNKGFSEKLTGYNPSVKYWIFTYIQYECYRINKKAIKYKAENKHRFRIHIQEDKKANRGALLVSVQ